MASAFWLETRIDVSHTSTSVRRDWKSCRSDSWSVNVVVVGGGAGGSIAACCSSSCVGVGFRLSSDAAMGDKVVR